MSTAGRRYVIINADDFGLSAGVNRGILETHDRGIVTSTSLLVRWPAAAAAAAESRHVPRLSLGLHVDLGEWTFQNGAWHSLYEVAPLHDRDAVEAEVLCQVDQFRLLTGQDPTHIDSHQHVHCHEPVRSILLKLTQKLNVPLRHCSAQIQYCGAFYGQTGEGEPLPGATSVESLRQVLADLPQGITELSCHPGWDADLCTMYRQERLEEARTLCDARIRECIDQEEIDLISFSDVPRILTAGNGALVLPAAALHGGLLA